MDKLRKLAVVGLLIDKLRENNSWCGETHVQKSIYFLQELFRVPLDYNFVLYKFGPFSFDLRDDLSECVASNLIEVIPHDLPYGPHLYPTSYMKNLMSKFPKTLSKYSPYVKFVADWLASKNVSELERLSTALYVLRRNPELRNNRKMWAEKVHELKPHQSRDRISKSIEELESFLEKVRL